MDEKIKLSLERGESLPLMESFYSIQGEGFYSGKAAYFLRIGGCDVGCHWCDVKESWDYDLHKLVPITEIINEINKRVDTVVITGGEPLMWNLNLLTKSLHEKGIKIHLETSGTHPITGNFDWICLSPKKMQQPLDNILTIADEFKVIVSNNHDLIWADEQRKNLNKKCKLYLQPEWSRREKMIPLIIDFIKNNKIWSISLQNHKYMKVP